MDCVNLKKAFGKKYRVRYEESYYAECGTNARTEVPWLMVIPCLNGQICPWGGRDLAACTKFQGRVLNLLKALPFARIAQDGEDGSNVLFDVKYLEAVAKIMKPRKRRRLPPEERARRVKRLQEYWADNRQVGTLRETEVAIGGPCATSRMSPSI